LEQGKAIAAAAALTVLGIAAAFGKRPARFPTRIAADASDSFRRDRAAYVPGVPLAAVAGLPGLLSDGPIPPRAVAPELPENAAQDRAILIRTGWDKHWGTEGYQGCACSWSRDVRSPRTWRRGTRRHRLLRKRWTLCRTLVAHLPRAGVLVVENLCNLSALSGDGFRFFAVPLAFADGVCAHVRAFAEFLPR
jgi:arylformamidase